jgi:hypothetical protein
MENIKIFTFIYSILVIIDALMTYTYYNLIFAPTIQLFGAISIAFSWFYLKTKKKYLLFTIPSIGVVLTIFYGSIFFNTTDFFQGLMAGLSAFLVGSYAIEIFKYYARISKQRK